MLPMSGLLTCLLDLEHHSTYIDIDRGQVRSLPTHLGLKALGVNVSYRESHETFTALQRSNENHRAPKVQRETHHDLEYTHASHQHASTKVTKAMWSSRWIHTRDLKAKNAPLTQQASE